MQGAVEVLSRICLVGLFVCLMLPGLSGCGQVKPPAEKPDSATPTTGLVPPATPVKNEISVTPKDSAAGQPALVATAADGTAEATFQKTLIAFQEGHLDAVYELLPRSYQADVQNVVREFAEKMDAELWAKSFDLLSRLTNILQSKKTLILNLDGVKKSPQYETIRDHYDAIASGLQDVVNSEVRNLNNLKKADVKNLLSQASQLLNDKGLPLPKFGDVTVATVDSNETTATLSYRDAKDKDGEPKQVEFVKVEGKWLPKSIAQGWPDAMAKVRAELETLPGQVASIKPVLMQQFEGLNGILNQIEKAKTSEQFNTAVMPLVLSMVMGKGLMEQTLRDADSMPRKANAVAIFINRELSESEQTKLKNAIVTAVDDPNLEYEIIPNDGKTRLRFTPVSKMEVVTEVITREYDGAKVTEDTDSRTIRVELK